jgi:hypothetical protein
MDYETLRYEQAGHVVTLTYDRPRPHRMSDLIVVAGALPEDSPSALWVWSSC